MRADSVRQALIYVSNGDAEAALVSKTLAMPMRSALSSSIPGSMIH